MSCSMQIRHQLTHVVTQALNVVMLRRRDVQHVEVHAQVRVRKFGRDLTTDDDIVAIARSRGRR